MSCLLKTVVKGRGDIEFSIQVELEIFFLLFLFNKRDLSSFELKSMIYIVEKTKLKIQNRRKYSVVLGSQPNTKKFKTQM